MRTGFIRGIGLLAIAGAVGGYFTKPDKTEHVEYIAARMVKAVMNLDVDEVDRISEEVSPAIMTLANNLVSKSMEISERFIFNVGSMDIGNGEKLITIGAYNHVFVFHDKFSEKFRKDFENLIINMVNQK